MRLFHNGLKCNMPVHVGRCTCDRFSRDHRSSNKRLYLAIEISTVSYNFLFDILSAEDWPLYESLVRYLKVLTLGWIFILPRPHIQYKVHLASAPASAKFSTLSNSLQLMPSGNICSVRIGIWLAEAIFRESRMGKNVDQDPFSH